jgi:hypothetical protein
MAYRTIGRGSRTAGLSGINEAMAALRALAKAVETKQAKAALVKVQGQGFDMIRSAIYHRKYGTSLATIFRKTRPRGKDGRSKSGFGLGTPVKTGALQRSLVSDNAPYSIYQQQVAKDGTMRVLYGGDPIDPYSGKPYFKYPEELYGFFEEGIQWFTMQKTLKNLGKDLAALYGKALQKHIASSVKRSR